MINTGNMRSELKNFVQIFYPHNCGVWFPKTKVVMYLLNSVDIKKDFGQGWERHICSIMFCSLFWNAMERHYTLAFSIFFLQSRINPITGSKHYISTYHWTCFYKLSTGYKMKWHFSCWNRQLVNVVSCSCLIF